MSSRKSRETEVSEEKVDNNEDGEETNEGLDYLKSFGKYFKKVWYEVYESIPHVTYHNDTKLGVLAAQVLLFNNELSEVMHHNHNNINYFV